MSLVKVEPVDTTSAQFYGYEYHPNTGHHSDAASLELITALLFGIENKDNIPPVRLFKYEENGTRTYELIYPTNPESTAQDGGHHRTLACILGQHQLPAKVYDDKKLVMTEIPEYLIVNIRNLSVESRPETLKYLKSGYKIPEQILNPRRIPSPKDITHFLRQTRGKPVTSKQIIETLYN